MSDGSSDARSEMESGGWTIRGAKPPLAQAPGSALRTYMFRRAGGCYLMELGSDEEARANAECNAGTVMVEDIYGRQVWPNAAGERPR
jgi:hypothetical protein